MSLAPEYLITGLPRMRSAWLSAVLSTPDLPCVHDRATAGLVDYKHGLSDPMVSCVAPAAMVKVTYRQPLPVVIIERNPEEAFASLCVMADRADLSIDRREWESLVREHLWFRERVPQAMVVPYDLLNDSYVVQSIGAAVGVSLSIPHIDRFQRLYIEQHVKCLRSAS